MSARFAGYLGAILFEVDLEQPLLGRTLSVSTLVDAEGVALFQQDRVPQHRSHEVQLELDLSMTLL